MKRLLTLTLMMAGLAGFTSHAQLSAGSFELGGSLQLSSPEEGDETLFIIADTGYFVSDALQLKLRGFLGTTGGTDFGSIGPGLTYHLASGDESVVPFIGASYQFDMSDAGSDDSYELNGGAKAFVSERTSVNVTGSYIDQDAGSTVALTLGISYYF